MINDDEKRSSDGGIGASGQPADSPADGVGGRQASSPHPDRGGGYQNNCTVLNFGLSEEKKRDQRLDELQKMGLQRIWIDIAEKIGVDNLLIAWRMLDSDQANHADDGRLLIPIRRYRTYIRYQRNRYIESLVEMNLSPREIKEKIERQLCEKISVRNILRISKRG
ncbi:hypothetical protein [Nitrosovibrio sp. Nv6]|uniref:hypothetical protein n=1 Tax=Nitrosovibrio sp. Nv6 TaxID=1855340 RepID=UPI0008B6F062|nr:hypothetical protein [Nitrosovibrio sp. Nv6]SEO65951.1 hypothetical protein SAMN05216316_0731 [Nitrosovibrio sp. Nv6]